MGRLESWICNEAELNAFLSGVPGGIPAVWPRSGSTKFKAEKEFLVLCESSRGSKGTARPVAIFVDDRASLRLFARLSHLRTDFSPVSAWCNVISADWLERIRDEAVESDLGGFEACWAGLVIAEASLLSSRPVANLKLVPCLATQSYCVARSTALWGKTPIDELLGKYDLAQDAMRSQASRAVSIRNYLRPIWGLLQGLSTGLPPSNAELELLTRAMKELANAKQDDVSTSEAILFALQNSVDVEFPSNFDALSAEKRLKIFDEILKVIQESEPGSSYRLTLCFLAGYIATVAAGGSASLTIAEAVADFAPEVTAFAYIIGGLGERVTWSSGFDGLGRLVTRELGRPFDIGDAPSCDVNAMEAIALVDKALNDPLVHLKLKQARVASVSLIPGVNLQIPFSEQSESLPLIKKEKSVSSSARTGNVDPWALMADALAPYLLERLANATTSQNDKSSADRPRQIRKGTQRKLL